MKKFWRVTDWLRDMEIVNDSFLFHALPLYRRRKFSLSFFFLHSSNLDEVYEKRTASQIIVAADREITHGGIVCSIQSTSPYYGITVLRYIGHAR